MTPTPKRKSSEASKSLNLKEIADLVGGELIGDPAIAITGVAGIKEAKAGDITFLSTAKYLPFLEHTQASAVITSREVVSHKKPLLRTSNPSQAFNKVVRLFTTFSAPKAPGVHPTAVIEKSVRLGKGVSIGPQVVIEADTVVGDHSVIEARSEEHTSE